MHKGIRSILLPLLFLAVIVAAVPPLTSSARAVEACNSPSTCPDPKSCNNWSGYYDCEMPFCDFDPFCGAKIGQEEGPATFQLRQQFRDCTLLNGSPCREYSNIYAFRTRCGC